MQSPPSPPSAIPEKNSGCLCGCITYTSLSERGRTEQEMVRTLVDAVLPLFSSYVHFQCRTFFRYVYFQPRKLVSQYCSLRLLPRCRLWAIGDSKSIRMVEIISSSQRQNDVSWIQSCGDNLLKNRSLASTSKYKQLPINRRLFQNTINCTCTRSICASAASVHQQYQRISSIRASEHQCISSISTSA